MRSMEQLIRAATPSHPIPSGRRVRAYAIIAWVQPKKEGRKRRKVIRISEGRDHPEDYEPQRHWVTGKILDRNSRTRNPGKDHYIIKADGSGVEYLVRHSDVSVVFWGSSSAVRGLQTRDLSPSPSGQKRKGPRMSSRNEVFGFSACSVIRFGGNKGLNWKENKAFLESIGIKDMKDSTIKIQTRWGARDFQPSAKVSGDDAKKILKFKGTIAKASPKKNGSFAGVPMKVVDKTTKKAVKKKAKSKAKKKTTKKKSTKKKSK